MSSPDIADRVARHETPLNGVDDHFDPHSSRQRTLPENYAKSTASFASISISESHAIHDNQETHHDDDPNALLQRPLATMSGGSKKAITICEDLGENDESSLLSNDAFGGASSKVSVHNDDQTIAQMTLASIEDAVRYAVAHWKIIIFGQLISFLSASAGASQATLSHKCDLNAPAFSSAFMYLGLTIFVVPLYIRRRREAADEVMREGPMKPMHKLLGIPTYVPGWKYVGASFLHFYANYFVILAFRFTSLTSIMLLDVLALPSSMILSVIFLKRRYVSIHFLGATVCMMGIVFNVLSDYELDLVVRSQFPNRLLGDFIAGIGIFFYGANNVIKESFVRGSGGPLEYLGCVGLLSAMWSISHAALFERQDIAKFFNGGGHCPVAVSGILMFLFAKSKGLKFFCGAHFLTISESALLNLSILTSDFWAVAFSIFAQHIFPSPIFWVAVTFTISGVIIYEIAPSPIVPEQDQPAHRHWHHSVNDSSRGG